MDRSRSHSAALLGVLALSGLLACGRSPGPEAKPVRRPSAARSEPSESRDASQEAPEEDRAAERALRGAQEAVRDAEERLDRDRQHETLRRLRNLGLLLYTLCQDKNNGLGPGGWDLKEPTVDVNVYPLVSKESLEGLLPSVRNFPDTDAWGHPYEIRLSLSDSGNGRFFLLRSPGRDGVFSGDSYTLGAFDPRSFDDDIVFADGMPVRWPQGDVGYQGFSR